jgi:2-iminobutanoate/2-iminopropanoate deaminase
MSRKIVSTQNAPAAIGPYSQAVCANGMVFTSGQVPIVPETKKIEATDIEGQTRQVMKNLKAVLEAAGSDFSKVIKATIFLKDLEHFGKVNEIYSQSFGEEPPARACVQVARLPLDSLVEIEMIALTD